MSYIILWWHTWQPEMGEQRKPQSSLQSRVFLVFPSHPWGTDLRNLNLTCAWWLGEEHQGMVAMERKDLARAHHGITDLNSLNLPNSKLLKNMITGDCFLFPSKYAQTRTWGVLESTGSWRAGILMSAIHFGCSVFVYTPVWVYLLHMCQALFLGLWKSFDDTDAILLWADLYPHERRPTVFE